MRNTVTFKCNEHHPESILHKGGFRILVFYPQVVCRQTICVCSQWDETCLVPVDLDVCVHVLYVRCGLCLLIFLIFFRVILV